AFRERCGLEQRLERAANPSGVAAYQVRGDHGFIDLRHSPLIPRDDCRRPLFRAGAPEKGGPRQRENNRAGRPRQRPLSDAIAVAPSYFIALVRARPERGPQLLVHGGLDRSADVLVDQCAQRDGFKLMRSDRLADTLAHGAFLRSPPWQAVCWSCTSPTGRMCHFSFPPDPGHDPHGNEMRQKNSGMICTAVTGTTRERAVRSLRLYPIVFANEYRSERASWLPEPL